MTDKSLTKYLQVPLTAAEKAEKHDELVRTLNDLERLEQHFQGLKDQHKANVKSREVKIKELCHDLGAGYVMRSVGIEEVADITRQVVLIKRRDTGAVVEEKPMDGK